MSKVSSKGFTCVCGVFHEYTPYVSAHTNVTLVHECKSCGAKHSIFNYRATAVTDKIARVKK